MHLHAWLPLAAWLISAVSADDAVYTDSALSPTWQDWSWSSTITYNATDLFAGSSGSSILVNSSAYAALSLKDAGTTPTFQGFAGLQFDIAGDNPDVVVYLSSTGDNAQTDSFALKAFTGGSDVVATGFTTLLMNFNDLPGTGAVLANDTWDRINFQAGGNGAVVCLFFSSRIHALTSY
jgi:hypothetical protein